MGKSELRAPPKTYFPINEVIKEVATSLQVFDKLDEYVNDESPVTTACLLTGYSGTGKSTLLANWYIRFKTSCYVYKLMSTLA